MSRFCLGVSVPCRNAKFTDATDAFQYISGRVSVEASGVLQNTHAGKRLGGRELECWLESVGEDLAGLQIFIWFFV